MRTNEFYARLLILTALVEISSLTNYRPVKYNATKNIPEFGKGMSRQEAYNKVIPELIGGLNDLGYEFNCDEIDKIEKTFNVKLEIQNEVA